MIRRFQYKTNGWKKMQEKNGNNMKACKPEDLWIINMMHYVSTFTKIINLLIKCYDTFRVYF
jgi:hypothetical protein